MPIVILSQRVKLSQFPFVHFVVKVLIQLGIARFCFATMHTILGVPWHISILLVDAERRIATKSLTQMGGN
jgi:hypothetical protein